MPLRNLQLSFLLGRERGHRRHKQSPKSKDRPDFPNVRSGRLSWPPSRDSMQDVFSSEACMGQLAGRAGKAAETVKSSFPLPSPLRPDSIPFLSTPDGCSIVGVRTKRLWERAGPHLVGGRQPKPAQAGNYLCPVLAGKKESTEHRVLAFSHGRRHHRLCTGKGWLWPQRPGGPGGRVENPKRCPSVS